ncbi:MAG: ComEC/Rec2 family competence protein [Victivallaceae bacterium]
MKLDGVINVFKGLRSGRTVAGMPALLILTGIIGALLPLVIFSCPWYEALLWILPLPVAGLFLLPRRQFATLVAAIASGFGSFFINQAIISGSYVSSLGGRERGAEILAKVVDTSCAGPAVSWLPNPALTTVEILKLRLNGDEHWQASRGLAAVRLPERTPLLSYGDIIRLNGTFRDTGTVFLLQENIVPLDNGKPIEAKILRVISDPGGKHFSNYLRSRNISGIFYCREFDGIESNAAGWRRPVSVMRNFLLRNVTAGVKNEKYRNLLATLLFGCRQGLDYAAKANYIKSGTIHIFTVSGLHVGILALLLFWILRWVPFKPRHLLVPGLVFLYVLSTGMHPPALRAWLMIAIWCVCRAFLFYIPALNIVFLAASLLLLKNPFYLNDMGFQFSFVVVGFLLLAARGSREWEALFRETLKWIPPKYLGFKRYWAAKWRRKLFLALSGCVVAWLASSGICLYYQGIYFPFSIVANFLLIPFVLVLFGLVAVKILLSAFAFLLPLTAWLVETFTAAIDFIAGISLDISASTHAAAPTFAQLLLFYVALALLVTAHRRFTAAAGLLGVGGMIVFWHITADFTAPSMTLLQGGGSQETACVIIEPAMRSATVINAPSFEAARGIAARLAKSGVREIDALVLSGSRRDFCAGAVELAKRFRIKEIVQLVPESRSKFFSKTAEKLIEQGTSFKTGKVSGVGDGFFKYESGKVKIIGKNQRLNIEYRSGLLHIKGMAFINNNGHKVIELVFGGRHPVTCEFLNSSVLEIRDYCFD